MNTQISTSVTILNSLLGYQGISLTNFDSTTLSEIAAGSKIEVASAFFTFTTDEAIDASSWTAITTATSAYLYLTPSGTAGSQILTASWESVAPVWSTSKQGWYSSAGSNIRVIGSCFKSSATVQTRKIIYLNNDPNIVLNGARTNVLFGAQAASSLVNNNNVVIGYKALSLGYNSYTSVVIGSSAALSATNIYNSVIIGASAGIKSIGADNVCIGYASANNLVSGSDNIIIGSRAAYGSTTGSGNIAIGHEALNYNENNYNIGIGFKAAYNCSSATNIIAIGYGALYNNNFGDDIIAIGKDAAYNLTGGSNLIAIGEGALYNNTAGGSNTAIGAGALYNNTAGGSNTAVGVGALDDNTTGGGNTAVGVGALSVNATGNNNAAIGYIAGFNSKGSNNSFIGYNAGSSLASTTSNIIALGDTNITAIYAQVTSITGYSDRRDKTNISDLSLGLDIINKLRPVEFDWDKREWYSEKDEHGNSKISDDGSDFIYLSDKDGSKKGKHDYSFIAQELLEIQKEYPWLGIVDTSNPLILQITSGKLLPIMVKAIQDLSKEIQILKGQINA